MPAPLNNTPIPVSTPIAEPEFFKGGQRNKLAGLVTKPWINWFNQFLLVMGLSSTRVGFAQATAQGASIGATDVAGGGVDAGVYRFSYYARITQAATTSSSLTVTLDWIDDGVAVAFSGAAIVGNTVDSFQSEVKLIVVDGFTPVRYSTAYASVGGTPMQYKLIVTLERVSA